MSDTRTKDINHSIYGLTPLQLQWSSAKLRRVMRDKRYAIKARNHFYAELLRRAGETAGRSGLQRTPNLRALGRRTLIDRCRTAAKNQKA